MTVLEEHKPTITLSKAHPMMGCQACPSKSNIYKITIGGPENMYAFHLCPACLAALGHLITLELK